MDAIDIAPALTRKGLRVIRPEGPWHGRRRMPGCFGGEPAMAQGPLGLLKLFAAWGAEVAVLIDWARRKGSGPVALGGVSLGRSEEHTSELQSLMRISYAVFCLKKKKKV